MHRRISSSATSHQVAMQAATEHSMILAVAAALAPAHGGALMGTPEHLMQVMFPPPVTGQARAEGVPTSGPHLEHLLREISASSEYRGRAKVGLIGRRMWCIRPTPPQKPVLVAVATTASPVSAPRPAPDRCPRPRRRLNIDPINYSTELRNFVVARGGEVTISAVDLLAGLATMTRDPRKARLETPEHADATLAQFKEQLRLCGDKALAWHAGLDVQRAADGRWCLRIVATPPRS